MDFLTRWIDRSATLRIASLDATRACRTICLLHDLEGEPARGFSQALCGALLMASDFKNFETFSLQLEISETTYHVDATPEGLVRGLVAPRSHASTASHIQGRRFGQKGLIYQSIVDALVQEVGPALAAYVRQSDQQESHMDLVVDLDEGGLPSVAKGAWLRGFPDTKPQDLVQFIADWTGRGSAWDPAKPWADLPQALWDSLATLEPKAFCPCSEERALGALSVLGRETIEEAQREGKELEVVCDYCHSSYSLAAQTVLDAMDAKSQG